ncbi:MAG: hypothetical protein LC776_09515, partial [Acidobacteria bacterium]|nr:hypothetical protein [Acidobacteriota bacterium]
LHETVDASVIRKDSALTVILTNHSTPGHSIEAEHVNIRLDTMAEPAEVYVQRIDSTQANPKLVWQEMGEPEYLTAKEVEQLEKASLVVKERPAWKYKDGVMHLETSLPTHAVAAITVEFKRTK